jgi:predicted RND superfamily exporter protein
MFEEPATAITRNSLVISIGFVPLLFAPLMPYITVGVFLICIMSISAVVTLFILPSAMLLGRSFLFPNVKREKKHV